MQLTKRDQEIITELLEITSKVNAQVGNNEPTLSPFTAERISEVEGARIRFKDLCGTLGR